MKTLLKIFFLLSIALIIFGYTLTNTTINGKFYIGVGVLIFAFVFMPLFIYYRYKDSFGNFIDDRIEYNKKKKN